MPDQGRGYEVDPSGNVSIPDILENGTGWSIAGGSRVSITGNSYDELRLGLLNAISDLASRTIVTPYTDGPEQVFPGQGTADLTFAYQSSTPDETSFKNLLNELALGYGPQGTAPYFEIESFTPISEQTLPGSTSNQTIQSIAEGRGDNPQEVNQLLTQINNAWQSGSIPPLSAQDLSSLEQLLNSAGSRGFRGALESSLGSALSSRSPGAQIRFEGFDPILIDGRNASVTAADLSVPNSESLANQINEFLRQNTGNGLSESERNGILSLSQLPADQVNGALNQALLEIARARTNGSREVRLSAEGFAPEVREVVDPLESTFSPEQRLWNQLNARALNNPDLITVQLSDANAQDFRGRFGNAINDSVSVNGDTLFLVNKRPLADAVNSGSISWNADQPYNFTTAAGDTVTYTPAQSIEEFFNARLQRTTVDPDFRGVLTPEQIQTINGYRASDFGPFDPATNLSASFGIPTYMTRVSVNGVEQPNPYATATQMYLHYDADGRLRMGSSDPEWFSALRRTETAAVNGSVNGSVETYGLSPGRVVTDSNIVRSTPGQSVRRPGGLDAEVFSILQRTEFSTYGESPLAIDMTGSGLMTSEEKELFDLLNNGNPVLINKLAPGSAWLTFDMDGDGIPGENGGELFGTATNVNGSLFNNGFDALRAVADQVLPSGASKKGYLDQKDIRALEEQIGLRLRSSDGTLKKLSEAGVQSLSLGFQDMSRLRDTVDENGVDHRLVGSAMVDGQQRDLIDLFFDV